LRTLQATSTTDGDDTTTSPRDESRSRAGRAIDSDRLAAGVAIAAAMSGVVWATARAVVERWVPVADNAAIAFHTQDVFSRHVPLLGMPSTLGVYAQGHPASHPGPLEFFALAGPYAIFGRSPLGLLIGAALVNIASIAVIAWAAQRIGGTRLVTVAMLAVTVLVWAVGNSVREVWNPHIALLPFAAFLVLSATVASGRLTALPLALLFGSFALQAHLSYIGLVGLVLVWVLASATWNAVRSARVATGDDRLARRRQVRRVALWSLLVVALCWWPPIYQQFTGDDPNISALVGGFTSGGSEIAGARFAVRYVGRIVGLPPPFGMRPSSLRVGRLGHASFVDTVRFAVPWVVLAIVAFAAWRRRATRALFVLATAGFSLVAATLTAMRVPSLGRTGLVYLYNVRWLWPVAMFFWFAIAYAIWDVARVGDAPTRSRLRYVATACCVLAVIVALVPRVETDSVDIADARLTRRLSDAVVARVDGGTYVVRAVGATGGITVAPGVAVELERHGVTTYLRPLYAPPISPWGEHRLYDGQTVDGTIWIVTGSTHPPSPTARRIASATGVDPDWEREAVRLRTSILDAIERDGGVRVTDDGKEVLERDDDTRTRGRLAAAQDDPAESFVDGSLAELIDRRFLAPPRGASDELRRYEALRPILSGDWAATAYLDGPPK
jgi:hypothetical protein